MEVAARLGGAPGRALADVAAGGFADGMGRAFLVGAAALSWGPCVTAVYLPARGARPRGPRARPRPDAGPVPAMAGSGATVQDAGAGPVDAVTPGNGRGQAVGGNGDDGAAGGAGRRAGPSRGVMTERGEVQTAPTALQVGNRRRPGRPRDARADAAIMDAAVAVLADRGPAGFTVDEVASRAGLRQGHGVPPLAVAGRAAARHRPSPGPRASGRGQRVAARRFGGDAVRAGAQDARTRRPDASCPGIIAEATVDPGMRRILADFIADRRERPREVVQRGVARGELPVRRRRRADARPARGHDHVPRADRRSRRWTAPTSSAWSTGCSARSAPPPPPLRPERRPARRRQPIRRLRASATTRPGRDGVTSTATTSTSSAGSRGGRRRQQLDRLAQPQLERPGPTRPPVRSRASESAGARAERRAPGSGARRIGSSRVSGSWITIAGGHEHQPPPGQRVQRPGRPTTPRRAPTTRATAPATHCRAASSSGPVATAGGHGEPTPARPAPAAARRGCAGAAGARRRRTSRRRTPRPSRARGRPARPPARPPGRRPSPTPARRRPAAASGRRHRRLARRGAARSG